MELYSLEEDEENELFITQTPSESNGVENFGGLIGDPMDFQSPCALLVGNKKPQYSDISNEEDFEIPCSQVTNKTSDRLVKLTCSQCCWHILLMIFLNLE